MCVVRGAEHHRRARLERGQVARGLEAVDARHRDVQQHHVRMVFGAGVQGGMAIAGLGHHLYPGFRGKQRAQAFARQRLVICDHHPHRSCAHVAVLPSSGTRISA